MERRCQSDTGVKLELVQDVTRLSLCALVGPLPGIVTSNRVLLSDHMEEHWESIGYKPDTEDLDEVDELDIQVGMKDPQPEPADSLRPDH